MLSPRQPHFDQGSSEGQVGEVPCYYARTCLIILLFLRTPRGCKRGGVLDYTVCPMVDCSYHWDLFSYFYNYSFQRGQSYFFSSKAL